MSKIITIILVAAVGITLGAVALGLFSKGEPFVSLNSFFPSNNIAPDTTLDEVSDEDLLVEVDQDIVECGIVVTSPTPHEVVVDPVIIEGHIANEKKNVACWPSFEGIAGTVRIVDLNGVSATDRIPIVLTDDSITTEPIAFSVQLSYSNTDQNIPGFLLFENTFSGGSTRELLEHRIPITF
ncbi:hypothetical protein COB64_01735 [Candidatus Wolfebacteria bacterium]|nr:MAG: hypothetical protein COB64_01735 [Candidatus Wolfebacteria bacterium]